MRPTLLLLAGFPGTGKTYLGNVIQREIGGFICVSPDQIKEDYCEKYGYDNLTEKKILEKAAWTTYYETVEKKMQEKQNVLSDYPFSEKQKPIFQKLIRKYAYQVVTIRLLANLEILFARQKNRDLDPERHLSHIMNVYHKGDEVEDRTKADNLLSYEEFIRRCTTRGYEKFSLGQLIEVDATDFAQIETAAILTKLKKILYEEPRLKEK